MDNFYYRLFFFGKRKIKIKIKIAKPLKKILRKSDEDNCIYIFFCNYEYEFTLPLKRMSKYIYFDLHLSSTNRGCIPTAIGYYCQFFNFLLPTHLPLVTHPFTTFTPYIFRLYRTSTSPPNHHLHLMPTLPTSKYPIHPTVCTWAAS